jgi:hypothetical protein
VSLSGLPLGSQGRFVEWVVTMFVGTSYTLRLASSDMNR